EAPALDQLHGQETRVARVFDRIQNHDVRVIETGDGSRLALEAGEAIRRRGQRLGQELDRHFAAQAEVARPIDLAHAAGAQRSEDFIGTESGCGRERHGGHFTPKPRQVYVWMCPATRTGETMSEPAPPDLTQGISVSDIPDGGMLAGRVGDEPALVARRGNEFFAIASTCTHYGGPLAEGLMVEDTVRCPWHHACFSLRTGEPLR